MNMNMKREVVVYSRAGIAPAVVGTTTQAALSTFPGVYTSVHLCVCPSVCLWTGPGTRLVVQDAVTKLCRCAVEITSYNNEVITI